MEKFTGRDSREWQVGRRRLAWRPRLPGWVRALWGLTRSLGDPITMVVSSIASLGVALGLIWYLLNWLTCLVVTPFAWLGRVAFGRPWPVVAYPVEEKRAEYWGSADGAAAADALVRQVADEIRQHGRPLSLTASPAASALVEQPQPPQTPVIQRLMSRWSARDRTN